MNHKKLNIGFLLTDEHAGKGGLENVLISITSGLKVRNITSHIFMLRPPEYKDFTKEFDHVMVMPPFLQTKWKKKLPKFIYHQLWKHLFIFSSKSFLQKNLEKSQLDALIILNLSKDFLRISSILESYKIQNPTVPIIAWPHGSLSVLNPKVSTLLKKKISIFDHCFAISQGLKTELEQNLSFKNVDLIYNPVDTALTIPRNLHKFIYIGRIGDPGKRVKPLLKILSQLKGDWSLDLIGASHDQQKNLEIEQYAKKLGIQSKTRFYGWQENPWDCIKEAGVLLLNSESEGFGLVLVEAMMRGIPCVSSNCPVGPAEIIQNDINGWLFPLDAPNKCLKILQAILDQTQKLPDTQIIQQSVQKFSTPNIINQFTELILKYSEKQ